MINTWPGNPELPFLLHPHAAVGGLPKILHCSRERHTSCFYYLPTLSSLSPDKHTHTLLSSLRFIPYTHFYLSQQSAHKTTHGAQQIPAEWSQVGRPFIFHANGNLVRLPIDWMPLVSQTMLLQSAARGGGGAGRREEMEGRRGERREGCR